MKVIVYGDKHDQDGVIASMLSLPCLKDKITVWKSIIEYEEFRQLLVESTYDLVIVSKEGEMGRLACSFTRNTFPYIPIFWFSDNRDFWSQSYQFDCTYFATKPVSNERLIHAFERYEKSINNYG